MGASPLRRRTLRHDVPRSAGGRRGLVASNESTERRPLSDDTTATIGHLLEDAVGGLLTLARHGDAPAAPRSVAGRVTVVVAVAMGPVEVDAFHRHHAVVELAIRDLKEGTGLDHIASGNFHANSAWLQCAVLAHNLIRWTAIIGGVRVNDELTVARTMRTRLLTPAGRLVNRAGRPTLRLPERWPWAHTFTTALDSLRLLRPVPI